MSNQDILETLELMSKEAFLRTDFEDLLWYICAKNSDSEAIITNDKNFPKNSLKVS